MPSCVANHSSAYHFAGLMSGDACRDPREKLVGDEVQKKVVKFYPSSQIDQKNWKMVGQLGVWSVLCT